MNYPGPHAVTDKKGTGFAPVPLLFSLVFLRILWASIDYVVPFGISRGVVRLSVIARKIAVSFVML
jgi:hypothetical protein